MSVPVQPNATDRFTIRGDVGAATFLPWIERHARRLGLVGHIADATPDRVVMTVAGPPDLIDAMELGCSLGPIEVWVETIQREPLNLSD